MQPYKKVFISPNNTPYSFNEEEPKIAATIDYARFIQQIDGPYSQHYELLKLLGQGGYGSVFQVRYKLNNELRAMKIINKKSSTHNDNFRKEFQILKQLDHPNILKLYHSFEDDDKFYIISELCEGGNLFDYMLSQDQICERDICKIMYQLMSAVQLAHNNKIAHRDIKPENILLDDEITTQIKLIDWGLLGMLGDEKLHQRCGSLHYVAPEVLEGNYDEKCDIWSCGVVLYVLLCNDPPFSGKDTQEILANIHRGNLDFKYKLWDKFSDEVKSLLLEMLQKDQNLRYSAKQVLQHQWFESRISEPIASQEYKESLVQLNAFTEENNQSLAQKRFIQAIILFISVEIVHKKDKEILYKIFRRLDKDADGTISKTELQVALKDLYGNEVDSKVNKIFEFLDINASGQLEFSEFIAATCKLGDIEKQLRIAFDFFDENKDGSITLDELGKVIGPNENWKEIFSTFDSDSDQRISFSEFQQALQGYVNLGKQLSQ